MPNRLPFLLACALAALALSSGAPAGTGMFVGAAEDAARSVDPVAAKAKMDLARLAGFDTIRLTSIWPQGRSAPSARELLALRNAAGVAQLVGIRTIVSVYPRGSRTTPRTPRERRQFAAYAGALARGLPAVSDFVIGNEPNLNRFWMPQFTREGRDAAAPAYLDLLAKSYDALKAVSPDINVIGGSLSARGQDQPWAKRQTHSPTTFIPDLGAALRASGRTRPVMDSFSFHPYLESSSSSPARRHAGTTVGLADYDRLVLLLGRAFRGTAQPGSTLPIVFDEFGVESRVAGAKRRLYRSREPVTARPVSEARQAASYRQALELAACQPNVAGLLLFHVSDERDLRRWQSGLLYADNTPKASLAPVRRAVRAAQGGTLAACAHEKLSAEVEVAFPPAQRVAAASGTPEVQILCRLECRYRARVVAIPSSETELSEEGTGDAGWPRSVDLPLRRLDPGDYRYAVRVFTVGRPGTAVTRWSEPFTVVRGDGEAPAASG